MKAMSDAIQNQRLGSRFGVLSSCVILFLEPGQPGGVG
jgi:hypothetical protein